VLGLGGLARGLGDRLALQTPRASEIHDQIPLRFRFQIRGWWKQEGAASKSTKTWKPLRSISRAFLFFCYLFFFWLAVSCVPECLFNKVARVVVSGGFALAESEGVRVRISWTLGERRIRVLMWLPGWIQSTDADCLLSATPEPE
jgi:hypothetical protein